MAKSEYLQREEAAKKQLGAKGVKKRVKQLPTAARASLREMTGIDVSRKGVSVDPMGVAMALPVGKVLKAAKALRAAGNISRADSLTARVVAKAAGGSKAAARGQREQRVVAFMRPDYPGVFQGPVDSVRVGGKARGLSESVFPRVGGAGTTVRRGRGTVNQKGLEEMIAGGREPSREMLRIPQILKGTNEAYESIAQKAIKAAGLRKTPKKRGGR
jgi:hypothetical protein